MYFSKIIFFRKNSTLLLIDWKLQCSFEAKCTPLATRLRSENDTEWKTIVSWRFCDDEKCEIIILQ